MNHRLVVGSDSEESTELIQPEPRFSRPSNRTLRYTTAGPSAPAKVSVGKKLADACGIDAPSGP